MKVHLAMGHRRSLCGIEPRQGMYDIRTIATFFHSEDSDQCERCLHHLTQRGYSIKKLRSQAMDTRIPCAQIMADRVSA